MAFKRRIGKATKSEQQRQDRCRRFGCVACWMRELIRFNDEGDAYSLAGDFEIHHITINGFTQSQNESCCLCSWHHRGTCLRGETTSSMTEKFGPSLAKGSVPFYEEFGRSETMLAFQNALIAGAAHIEAAA